MWAPVSRMHSDASLPRLGRSSRKRRLMDRGMCVCVRARAQPVWCARDLTGVGLVRWICLAGHGLSSYRYQELSNSLNPRFPV
jgi:hypothetical protein